MHHLEERATRTAGADAAAARVARGGVWVTRGGARAARGGACATRGGARAALPRSVRGTGRRVLLVLSMLVSAIVLFPGPASAHAQLVDASPADRDELPEAPDDILLTFDEAVTTPGGGIRVFNSQGERVDTGGARTTGDPETVTVDLVDELGSGTYVVTWRVASADGHPVRGAYLFTVGDAATVDDSLLAELFSDTQDRGFAVAAAVLRWFMYAGTLLAAGGAVFLGRLRREIASTRPGLVRVVTAAAVVGIVSTVVGVFLQAALVTGLGVAAFVDVGALGDTMASPFGLSSFLRVAGLAALAVAVTRSHWPQWAAPVGGATALLALLLEGHTLTTDPQWLVMAADALHVAAAALWLGGLTLLAADMRLRSPAADPMQAGRVVAGFSRLATVAIVGVIAAGVTLGWVEVRALRALTSTTYGWTLVVKVALFLPVLAAGVYNNRRLVPAIARARRRQAQRIGDRAVPAGGSGGASPVEGAAWRLLQRAVILEVGLILAVLGATAVLVSLQPAAEAAGITGAYSTYVPLGEEWELNLTVDPNRAGQNEIHMYVLADTGRQVEVEGDVEVALSLPSHDIGPVRRTASRVGPGHFLISGPELSVPGQWEITVAVPASRFEQVTATVPVVVNP